MKKIIILLLSVTLSLLTGTAFASGGSNSAPKPGLITNYGYKLSAKPTELEVESALYQYALDIRDKVYLDLPFPFPQHLSEIKQSSYQKVFTISVLPKTFGTKSDGVTLSIFDSTYPKDMIILTPDRSDEKGTTITATGFSLTPIIKTMLGNNTPSLSQMKSMGISQPSASNNPGDPNYVDIGKANACHDQLSKMPRGNDGYNITPSFVATLSAECKASATYLIGMGMYAI